MEITHYFRIAHRTSRYVWDRMVQAADSVGLHELVWVLGYAVGMYIVVSVAMGPGGPLLHLDTMYYY